MDEKKKPRSDLEEDYKPTILFTAGTALVALCLKRAVVTVFLTKQWHMYVFLVLNLVLLAIMLTSMSSSSFETTPCKTQQAKSEDEVVKKGKRKRKHQKRVDVVVDHHVHQPSNIHKFTKVMQGDIKEVIVSSCSEDDKEEAKVAMISEEKAAKAEEETMSELSDEELNERVESFIATFRRHLSLDARNI